MKKRLVAVLCAIVMSGAALTGCGSGSSGAASASTEASSPELSNEEKSYAVTVIEKVADENGLGITFPDITDESSWTYLKDSETGYINVAVIGKDSDGSDDLVTMWFEYDGDDYTVHYYYTQQGFVIDDGTIQD